MTKMKTYLHKKKRAYLKLYGTDEKPRLSVFRSRKHIYAQLINDRTGMTLASFNSLKLKKKENIEKKTKSIISYLVGENLAKEAKNLGILKVIFDRNFLIYHGRVKQLAEGARQTGLLF